MEFWLFSGASRDQVVEVTASTVFPTLERSKS